IETILALELLRQLVLLDERLDLERARLRVRRLLPLLVELRVARRFRRARLLGGTLLFGGLRRCFSRLRVRLLRRLFHRTHLLLGDEAGLEQLLAQTGAHSILDWKKSSPDDFSRPYTIAGGKKRGFCRLRRRRFYTGPARRCVSAERAGREVCGS